MTEQLYTVKHIANMLGVTYNWVHNHLKNGAPQPDFTAPVGGKVPMLLWTQSGLTRWLVYHASTDSLPNLDRYTGYSDHKAVNLLWGSGVTWKLWWQHTHDGGTVWWFSTPDGWYSSGDDGRSWHRTGKMVRPTDYRYVSVNGNVKPGSCVAAILRSCALIRKRIEESK